MVTRVVIPYVDGMLSRNLLQTVMTGPYVHWFYQMDPQDEGAYGRLVRTLWKSGLSTVIVEHDVEPTAAQLREICSCEHDWCVFNYDDGLYPDGPMFGCVHFSAGLMARHPHAAEVALVEGKRKDQETPWWRVDAMMARDLMIRGERWVAHESRVHHVHTGPPSGPA